MGVFVTGRQVALEIDMPGWWLANASVDMDFRRGLYYDSSTTNPRAATDFLSCTRASIGYATTSTGTLTSFASNTLRLTDVGLLVEDARTNACTDSQDFSTWAVNVAGCTVNAAVAPDGTTTADKLIASSSGGPNGRYKPLTTSGQSTWTVYAKAAGYGFAALCGAAGSDRYTIIVDLTTGAITKSQAAGSPTGVITSVETLANGWFRLRITLNQSATEFSVSVSPDGTHFIDSNGFVGSFSGNDVDGIYVWGAQCEVGAFPSSYVPTTGSTATRAADLISISSPLATVIAAPAATLLSQALGLISSAVTKIFVFNSSSAEALFWCNAPLVGGIGGLVVTGNSINGTLDKGAYGWNPSGRSVVLNGGTAATDAAAITPGSTLYLGSDNTGSSSMNSYMTRFSAWNSKLANATLQGFTAP